MLCSKVHFIRVFKLKLFSYKSSRELVGQGEVQPPGQASAASAASERQPEVPLRLRKRPFRLKKGVPWVFPRQSAGRGRITRDRFSERWWTSGAFPDGVNILQIGHAYHISLEGLSPPNTPAGLRLVSCNLLSRCSRLHSRPERSVW